MKNKFLLEQLVAKTITAPVDLNTAANTGARVDMKGVKRVTFIAILAAGSSTTAHTFTLKQHTVASSGTPANLSVDNPYYHKIGAATSFTKVDPQGSAAAAYDLHSLLADSAAIVVFEVLAEQLTEGYRWVSLDTTDSGGAQLGCVIALADADFNPAYDAAV